MLASLLSCLNWTIAYGLSPVLGSTNPTGFNGPNKEEYESFWKELVNAEVVELHEFEKREIFEGCMPVEVMAKRGICFI